MKKNISIVRLYPLKIMMQFISCKASRANWPHQAYLKGIFLEPHPDTGLTIFATDGVRMGVWHEAEAQSTPELVYLPYSRVLMQALKAVRHLNDGPFAVIDPKGKTLATYFAEPDDQEQDGQRGSWLKAAKEVIKDTSYPQASVSYAGRTAPLPSWRELFSSKLCDAPSPVLSLDAGLLDTFNPVSSGSPMVITTVKKESSFAPMHLIHFAGVSQFIGLLMPVENGDGHNEAQRRLHSIIGRPLAPEPQAPK